MKDDLCAAIPTEMLSTGSCVRPRGHRHGRHRFRLGAMEQPRCAAPMHYHVPLDDSENEIAEGAGKCWARATWRCAEHGWRCGVHSTFSGKDRLCSECRLSCIEFFDRGTAVPMW